MIPRPAISVLDTRFHGSPDPWPNQTAGNQRTELGRLALLFSWICPRAVTFHHSPQPVWVFQTLKYGTCPDLDRRKSWFQSLERAIFGCSIAILQRLRNAALALVQHRTRGKRSLVSSNGIFLDVYPSYIYISILCFSPIHGHNPPRVQKHRDRVVCFKKPTGCWTKDMR